MTPEWVSSVVAAIVAITTIAFFVIRRKDDQENPIPKIVAEATVAEQLTGAAATLVSGISKDLLRVSNECQSLRDAQAVSVANIETLRAENVASREAARVAREAAEDAATTSRVALSYIVRVIEWSRISDGKPFPTPPPELDLAIARLGTDAHPLGGSATAGGVQP